MSCYSLEAITVVQSPL